MLSDTATVAPGSYLCAIYLTMGAILFMPIAVIRWQLIQKLDQAAITSSTLNALNRLSVITATLKALGALILAYAPYNDNQYVVHVLSANTLFIAFTMDMYLQSRISYMIHYDSTGRLQNRIFYIALITFIWFMLCNSLTFNFYQDIMYNYEFRRMLNYGQPGYIIHTIGAIMEWTHVLTYGPYAYSFRYLCKVKLN